MEKPIKPNTPASSISLNFAYSSVAKIDVLDTHFVATLKNGKKLLIKNAALKSTMDPSFEVVFTDKKIKGQKIIQSADVLESNLSDVESWNDAKEYVPENTPVPAEKELVNKVDNKLELVEKPFIPSYVYGIVGAVGALIGIAGMTQKKSSSSSAPIDPPIVDPAKELAISKIVAYADNNANPAPTVQDCADGNTWASGTYTLSASMAYHQVVISGASGDIVNIMETTWANSGTVSSNGITYNVYTNTAAKTQLFVENGVSVNLNTSPIILDLNGDGVHTTSLDNSIVSYDLNANGINEHTAWTDGKDGFLVLDLNQNGLIENGTELFGNGTTLADGTKAKDGYEALKQYDENKDNVIDVNDSIFAKLQIWVDKNVDGVSTTDELHSLTDVDIKSLNLIADSSPKMDNGNLLGLVSNYTKTDSSTHEMADVWFSTERVSIVASYQPTIYDELIHGQDITTF